MFWGLKKINETIDEKIFQNAKYVMGYNEPEGPHQSQVSPK